MTQLMQNYADEKEEIKDDLNDQNFSQTSRNSNRMTTRSMKRKMNQDNQSMYSNMPTKYDVRRGANPLSHISEVDEQHSY